MNENPYLPLKCEIVKIVQETGADIDIKTYTLKFCDGSRLDYMPGQFIELSVPSVGEAPFGFASNPLYNETIEISIKRTGLLTEVVHALRVGDFVWVRGPFGNTFPIGKIEGSDILFIGGGIGLAPLRPLITYCFDASQRDKFGKISILAAAKNRANFVYYDQFPEWRKIKDTVVKLTIDTPEDGWTEKTGYPHTLISEMKFNFDKAVAVLCGPPVMIKLVSQKLLEIGMPKSKIITTLEMRMTCGIGKCGKCNIGHQYICVDGPVYSLEELDRLPNEY